MATRLNRRVVRETSSVDPSFHCTLMICLEEGGKLVRIWKKGHRLKLTVTFEEIWRLALKNRQAEVAAERKARRSR